MKRTDAWSVTEDCPHCGRVKAKVLGWCPSCRKEVV